MRVTWPVIGRDFEALDGPSLTVIIVCYVVVVFCRFSLYVFNIVKYIYDSM